MEVFHGPLATSKGVRLFGTDALRSRRGPFVEMCALVIFRQSPNFGP
jgi:hypothetical protein